MSKYTTEVRFICETEAGELDSVGYNDIDTVIASSRAKIFNFSYPIWDNTYKSVLETKILRHYYTREIAFETYPLWKLKLATRLQEIMPYYNQLYETTVLEFNPLYDVNLTTEHTGEGSHTGTDITEISGGDTKTTSGSIQDVPNLTTTQTFNNVKDELKDTGSDTTTLNGDHVTWDVYSDTPQGALTNVDNETYLTNARKTTDTDDDKESKVEYGGVHTNIKTGNVQTEEHGSNTKTFQNLKDTTIKSEAQTKLLDLANTDNYIHQVYGKSGGTSYSKLIEDFRKTLINIDMRIINELSDLFFGLW